MLREEPKPAPRVRVCGDLARYLDEEDLLALQQSPVVVAEAPAVISDLCLADVPATAQDELQAA